METDMNRQQRLNHYRKELNEALRDRCHKADVVADREGRFSVRAYDRHGRYIGGSSSISDVRKAVTLADYYMS